MFPQNISPVFLGALIAHHTPTLTQRGLKSDFVVNHTCLLFGDFTYPPRCVEVLTKRNDYEVDFPIISLNY